MTRQTNKFIEFKNVTKKFGDFTALDSVSLAVPKGVFLTLLGPSGCGKTTLLRQLAGFSDPESGDIILNGRRINGLPPYKRNTPLVFQEYALFPHMSVYQNISYGLKLQKTPKIEKEERINDMLKLFNLVGLGDRYPRQLSGGQQQRVAFARALIMNEEVLLLDEPLSNLDAKLRVEVRSSLREIQQSRNITALYVTHDQDEALSMSDLIAVMQKGKIEQLGTPYDIYFKPANTFVADFIGIVNFLKMVVLSKENKKVRLQYNEIILEAETQIDVLIGEEVTVMMRPEAIRIQEPESANTQLTASVVEQMFLGRIVRYTVKHGENVLIIDDPNPNAVKSEIEKVGISFDQDKIHILKQG